MRETRRRFLIRGAIAGTFALRALRGQTTKPVPVPELEVGEPTRLLALRNVTVIDATGKPAMPGMTVVIAGNKIQSIGRTAPPSMPAVDARGKFLIPGLWDMHVHDSRGEINPLFIANGVTGVRTMGGTRAVARQFLKRREEVASGKRLGPRFVVGSQTLVGPAIHNNPDEGRLAVRNAVQDGADFIKVYDSLSAESYFAIVAEAKRLNIPFAGHVPVPPGLEECAKAGQKSVEHMMGVYGYLRQITGVNDAGAGVRPERLSREHAAALFGAFTRHQVWLCPTITTIYGLAGYQRMRDDSRLKYFSPVTKAGWDAFLRGQPGTGPSSLPTTQRRYESLGLIGAMHKAGVGILAGTDTTLEGPQPYVMPGFGVHDELRHLVVVGLSPMAALQTATYNPARFLGLLESLGTVERGKLAELVLLDANPLDDISNTTKINMVFTGGRVYRRPALDAMLSAVEMNVKNAFAPDQDVLSTYVGIYEADAKEFGIAGREKVLLNVALDDGILWLGLDDGPKQPMMPISDTIFDGFGGRVEFANDVKARVVALIIKWPERQFRADRKN